MKTYGYIFIKTAVRWVAGLLLTIIVAALVFCSCIREEVEVPVIPPGAEVTLSVQVPGGVKPGDGADARGDGPAEAGTRAMPADEARIDEVYVLLFLPGGAFEGAYPGSTPQNHPSIPGRRTFTVTLPEGNFDVMVMANSQNSIISAGLTPGMSRTQVSGALRLRQTGKWNVAGGDLFPFWGELKNAVLVKGGTLGVIPLNRAVAKIDVISSDAVKADFTLQTVAVYHWQEYMALIPDEGTMSGDEVTTATRTGPALGLYPAAGKMTYSGADISAGGITSKIYLNETPNPGSGDFPVMPCLIVGWQLTGETGLRYYRIDLSDVAPNGTRTYRDILRNHHYSITLKDVLSKGSDTEEDAYETTSVEIETDIRVWEEGDLKNVIIDGEYWLRVDPAEFELAREAHAATTGTRAERFSLSDYFFEIESNTEWKIDQTSIVYSPTGQNDWFSLNNRDVNTNWSGAANTVADMEIVVTENTSGQPRKATFNVEAGTIRFPVTVTQTTERMTRIMLYNMDGTEWNGTKDLISLADVPAEFEFIVEWYPAELPCEVLVSRFDGYPGTMPYENNYEFLSTTLTGGRNHYHLKMKNFNDNEIDEDLLKSVCASEDFEFKVGNVNKSGWLVHNLAHLVYEPKTYRLDLPRQQFFFTTSAAHVVKEVRDPYDILTAETKSLIENHSFQTDPAFFPNDHIIDLNFKESTPAKDGKKVYVTFSFPYTPGMPDKTVELEVRHLHPNCYMVTPGSSLHIPISKAFWAWRDDPLAKILEPNDLSVELLWQDSPSVVSEIALTPVYTKDAWDSEIFVRLGSDEGNAVVALRQGGEIIWSWHIWSTDYDPDGGGKTYQIQLANIRNEFMDRNLGALRASTATREDIKYSQGLFYQNGRKDPFPPMEDYVENPGQQSYNYLEYRMHTYDINGNRHPRGASSTGVWGKAPITTTDNYTNYLRSVNNPTLYLTSGPPQYDWMTLDRPSEYPWYEYKGAFRKTEFDPCPEGWKIPDAPQPNPSYWGSIDSFGAETHNYGVTYTNIGYFPGTGFIDFEEGNAGNYKGVGVINGTWLMEQGDHPTRAKTFCFINTNNIYEIIINWRHGYESIYRSAGLSVRCMRYDRSRFP